MTEETLFAAAIEKGDPAERAAFLAEACAGDTALRQRVEALLQSHAETGFLKTPAIQRACGGAAEEPGSETAAGNADAATPSAGEKPSLEFLAPSDKPGALGRIAHYEIQAVIGQGGMGIVLKAFDETLHRVVAIKVMAAPLATNAAARTRFTREAQAQAAVSHDHVVTIHAVDGDNPRPYLVMQYVAGLSLQQRLDRDGPLTLHEILRIGMQTASGLAAAHAQGLVHRDIKPANILLENGVERVKVTDFGLARVANEASLTQSGVVAGTPHYMSPEQAEGKPLDQRTDLFSLGSVLYAMCTGRAPFRADGTMAVLKRVCEETPTPIRETNPDSPEWLVAIIDKLHAKDPAERYQSAAEVAELLGQHLAHVQHPSLVPAPAAPSPLSPRGRGVGGEGGGRRRGRRWWAAAAAALVLLTAGLGLSEATGVTNVRATVIRIFTGGDRQMVRGAVQPKGAPDASAALSESDEIRRFEGPRSAVFAVAYSPRGNIVAAGYQDACIRLWDANSGKLIRLLEVDADMVSGVAFSNDEKQLVSAGGDGTVRLWDVATGKPLQRLETGAHLHSLSLSADGTRALCAGDVFNKAMWTIQLWDLKKGERIRRPGDESSTNVHAVAISPDGRWALSGGQDSIVRLWDVASGQKLQELPDHSGWLGAPAFSFDGRMALSFSLGPDKSIRLWKWEQGKLVLARRLNGHKGGVRSAAFSPNGRLVVSNGVDKACRRVTTFLGQ